MQALIKDSGLTGKAISSTNVSFTIVPRINAAGRLGLSEKSVSLLLTEDYEEADEISSQLCCDNSERQEIERDILEKIDEIIRRKPSLVNDKIIVIDGENWHQGVIGLIAAKVKEAYGKPAIVISKLGGTAKGSGRSVEGFPLCDAVFACSDLLTHRGGHPMAVGLSLDTENIPAFRQKINEFADNFGKMPYDKINIDCKLNPAYINLDLLDSLSLMQPYGAGNPTPVFGLYNMTLRNITPLSGNKHLRLTLSRGNTQITAMKFFTSTEEFPYKIGETLDLAVNLDRNEFNGNVSVSVIVRNIKSSDCDTEKLLDSRTNYEDFCRGKQLNSSQLSDLMPDRNDFALLYRYLKNSSGYAFDTAILPHMLDNRLSFGKIKVILEAMRELGLIEFSDGMKTSGISVLPVNGKVSLESAPIIRKLREVF